MLLSFNEFLHFHRKICINCIFPRVILPRSDRIPASESIPFFFELKQASRFQQAITAPTPLLAPPAVLPCSFHFFPPSLSLPHPAPLLFASPIPQGNEHEGLREAHTSSSGRGDYLWSLRLSGGVIRRRARERRRSSWSSDLVPCSLSVLVLFLAAGASTPLGFGLLAVLHAPSLNISARPNTCLRPQAICFARLLHSSWLLQLLFSPNSLFFGHDHSR